MLIKLLPPKLKEKRELKYSFQEKMDIKEARKILNINKFSTSKNINNQFKKLAKLYGKNDYLFLKIREAKKICDENNFFNKLFFF